MSGFVKTIASKQGLLFSALLVATISMVISIYVLSTFKEKKASIASVAPIAVVHEQNDMLAAADINAGKKLSYACSACHSFEKDGPTKVGPNLYGIVGARIARRENFDYSESLKRLRGGVWTVDILYQWLRDPTEFVPGTKMAFGGLPDPQDRMDVIAYLMTLK